jgi:predicted nucleic acid-binding protein
MVPKAVEQEIIAGPAKSPARRWLQDHRDQYVVHAVAPVPSVTSWELGDGETAALSWAAQHEEWTVILDDRAGRRCGRALDRSLTGTLGLLLLAKEEAYLSEIKPALNALVLIRALVGKLLCR